MFPESVVAASVCTVPPPAPSVTALASDAAPVVWSVPPLNDKPPVNMLLLAPIATVPPLRFSTVPALLKPVLLPVRVRVPVPLLVTVPVPTRLLIVSAPVPRSMFP